VSDDVELVLVEGKSSEVLEVEEVVPVVVVLSVVEVVDVVDVVAVVAVVFVVPLVVVGSAGSSFLSRSHWAKHNDKAKAAVSIIPVFIFSVN